MSDFIKEFWDSQADKFKDDHGASWGDVFALDLEVKTLAKYIPKGQHVLDAGCANGFSFFRQVSMSEMEKAVGIDYSEPMIREAKEELVRNGLDNVELKVADIRDLPFEDETFDVTYTTRVLINLPNWDDQVKGIEECLRVTKTGGTVIFMEAFWEPLMKLNSMRSICGLPMLVEHDFNRYIKKARIDAMLNDKWISSWECDKWSSLYYLGTRLLRDLVPDVDQDYGSDFNNMFYEMALKYDGGDCGIQEAYIVRK